MLLFFSGSILQRAQFFAGGDAVRFPAKNASGRVYRGAGRKYCFMEEWAETIEISQREWYNIPYS